MVLLTEKVVQLLLSSEFPASYTIEQCATKMAMSMTSFRRKLTQEETTFKLIQGKFLNELCVNALLSEHIKVDDLAITLGYSERATFERAFRHKFGITPAKFRELSLIGHDKNNRQKLVHLANNMPPLSGSCQQLLIIKDHENIDIKKIVTIVEKDPILLARLMGLASKAIYGKTPNTLEEAIGRNLGVNTVINIAMIYAVKDALQDQVATHIINDYTHALIMAPKLFQLVRRDLRGDLTFDVALTEQVLVFALLGIFLLCHKNAYKHQFIVHSLQGIEDLHSLNHHIKESVDLSLFDASSLMLSLWHIDAIIIKKLKHLDKVSRCLSKGNKEDDAMLFMLNCLYSSAAGRKEYEALSEQADFLHITCFDEIASLLFTNANL